MDKTGNSMSKNERPFNSKTNDKLVSIWPTICRQNVEKDQWQKEQSTLSLDWKLFFCAFVIIRHFVLR